MEIETYLLGLELYPSIMSYFLQVPQNVKN